MKTESQLNERSMEPAKPTLGGRSDDPFAEDLFAVRDPVGGKSTATAARRSKERAVVAQCWYSRLPRVTADEVQASSAMATLPSDFYSEMRETFIQVLSRYSLSSADQVGVELAEFHETDFSSALSSTGVARVFANFVCEPTLTPVSVEVDDGFAVMLIDRMLGGNCDPPNSLRPLTTAELAVIEFLFLSLASELNRRLGAPLVRLESIGEPPSWLTLTAARDPKQRGFTAAWQIYVREIAGIARAHLPAQALIDINRAQDQLRSLRTQQGSLRTKSKLKTYTALAPDLRLAILVGETGLTLQEFVLLERGDIMVIEKPELVWSEGRFNGALRIRVADGEESLILGDAQTFTSSTIKLKIESVTIGESREAETRLRMQNEIEIDEVVPEETNGLDSIMLTVRVELAARRLRLDELARLRTNQILDLGCDANDPVDLVVDGRHVARGELVDIDGRLGVRIKQVATQTT
jgi:type III secretion system YscQ/HrcQ family protein